MTRAPAEAARLSRLAAAWIVARRDFTAILFSKAFFFFLLGPILLVGISSGAGVVGAKAAQNAHPPQLAVALDHADARTFARSSARLAPMIGMPAVVMLPLASAQDPRAILQQGNRDLGAVLSGTLAKPQLTGTPQLIREWSGKVALIAADAEGRQAAYPHVRLEPTATSGAARKSAQIKTATSALTLMFLLTVFLAGMVMSNLVEEKANKIIEILAAAVPMDAVFMGKLFAMLAISFVGIMVWGSLLGLILFAGGVALPALPDPAVGWPIFIGLFVLYFSMSYLLIGSVFLTIGAMAPTVRDVQTLSMPATMLQLGVFFLATYASTDPSSPAEIVAILLPPSSPYAMIGLAGQVPALWPHVVALAWQALWVMLFIRVGSTLFRRKVMKSGPQGARKSRGLLTLVKGSFRNGSRRPA